MKPIAGLLTALAFLAVVTPAPASDPTGVYSVIEKVTIANAGTSEETIILRGVFITSVGRRHYNPPVHGYFYFKLQKGKEAVCRKEWADFQRVAGTGQCVAFASRYRPLGRVRGLHEAPASPDVYPLNVGVRRFRLDSNASPVEPLSYFPRPTGPAEAAAVPPGKVTLTVANIFAKDKQLKYVFEIRDARGRTETSPEVAPGKRQTSWSPKLQIERGGRYTWRAWVIRLGSSGKGNISKGPVAVGHFRGARGL